MGADADEAPAKPVTVKGVTPAEAADALAVATHRASATQRKIVLAVLGA